MNWIKNLLAKFAGKSVAKKLDLKEGNMSEGVNAKPWYKSKSVWNGIVVVLVGLYEGVKMNINPALPEIPGWLLTFLGAAGIYSRVVATQAIGKPTPPEPYTDGK